MKYATYQLITKLEVPGNWKPCNQVGQWMDGSWDIV